MPDNKKSIPQRKSIIQKFFYDDEGQLVLFQVPNLPIILWFGCVIVGKFISEGTAGNAINLIGFGALFTWAWLEIFSGSSYFRRILGLVVLVISVSARI